jgi:putative RNA 2'-phosphotransferase
VKRELINTSKFLSLVLRHEPQAIGLTLGPAGWVEVDELLAAMARHGRAITRSRLEEVVATNDKKRFSFSDDGLRIRASQGHSVEVELGYAPAEPPEVLFHGTCERFVEAIWRDGLLKMQRHHVHLSDQIATAVKVGERRGKAVIFVVAARRMREEGFEFFRSENGVWLTEHVPCRFLEVRDVWT